MKGAPSGKLEKYRIKHGYLGSNDSYGNTGAFLIPGPNNRRLQIISADGIHKEARGWDHVSVSVYRKPSKIPTWEEMSFVKDIFWDNEEVVMQLHPAKSQYVNNHPGCLHLWRPIGAEIPLPPPEMVGRK